MSVLARILASKQQEIEALAATPPPIATSRTAIDVAGILKRATPARPLALIAEVKFKSPSAGALSRALGATDRTLAYARAGAAMVSILCDGPFFDGGWHDLAAARARLDAERLTVPLLAKEFVLAEVQIERARACGADAVLLIARIVTEGRLRDLGRAARDAGIEPIIEVMDDRELDAALGAGARVVGVNARDLDTLAMDAQRTARVLAAIPRAHVAIHLSGVKTPDDVRAIAAGRADAALVGEILMRQDDPGPLLEALVSAASG